MVINGRDEMVRVIVVGAAVWMGKAICHTVLNSTGYELAGSSARKR